jgi:hypothetical protein
MSDPWDDPREPCRVGVSLLTAGVDGKGLEVVEKIIDDLNRDQLEEVIVALVGMTLGLVGDQKNEAVKFLAMANEYLDD